MSNSRHEPTLVASAIAVLLAVAHLAWIPLSLLPVYPDFDAAGYLTAAHVIAAHGDSRMPRESPLQFVGVHWYSLESGGYVSRYPPGFPVVLAALLRTGGTTAALAINPLLASVALLLLFALCRPHVGDIVALLSVILLAANPLANGQAIHVDSHPATMVCVLAIVLILDRWQRRPRMITAFAAGLLLGVLPTIRYAEAVCAAGAAAFLCLSRRRTPNIVWHAVAILGGMLLPTTALLHRNWSLFGSWWRTGYAFSLEQSAFSFANLRHNLGPYLLELWQVALLALPLGIIGIALLSRTRESRPIGMLVAIAIVLLLTTYAAYYWRSSVGDSQPIRFLLPVVPLLVFATAVAVQRIRSSYPILGVTLMALMMAQAALQVAHSRQRLASAAGWSAPGIDLKRGVEQHVSADSIIVAGLPVATSLEAFGRWRLADGDFLGRLCEPPTPPITGVPNPLTGRDSVAAHLYADLDCPGRRQRVLDDLKAWAGDDAAVYIVGGDTRRDLPGEWKEVGSITLIGRLQHVPPRPRAQPDIVSVRQLVR